jgi:hypothetical protein
MAVKRRLKNEWRKRKPLPSEVTAAKKLAKKVDAKLLSLMEAETE